MRVVFFFSKDLYVMCDNYYLTTVIWNFAHQVKFKVVTKRWRKSAVTLQTVGFRSEIDR